MADIEFRRGDTSSENVTLLRGGTPIDVSAARSIRFTAKRRMLDATALISKSLADGIVVVDAAQGKVQVQIDPADTVDFPPDVVLLWDVELVESDGTTSTPASGDMLILGDISTPVAP